MEQNDNIQQMLSLFPQIAFCAKEDTICFVNEDAARCQLEAGISVRSLLMTGAEEYASFSGGCLYLNVAVSGRACGATVSRIGEYNLFLLEQETEKAELRAIALAAQELRLPLSSIMTVAEELLPETSDPAATEMAARINRGLFRMLRIIGNMSDAYRYELEPEACMESRNITAVFEEIFEHSAALLQKSGIRLSYSGLNRPVFCLADKEKLERAVNNLLSNAVIYAPKNSTIQAKLTLNSTLLSLTIQDEGAGFSPETRSNVYERFRREPGIEDGRHGIGLGMVLVRSVATMHGGTVLMQQSPENGTRVTMTMKLQQSTSALVQSPAFRVDYAGERDHALIELSDVLPPELFSKES